MADVHSAVNMTRAIKEQGSPDQDLITAKVVAMVVLGFVSFFVGVLPVKLAAWFHFGADDAKSSKKKIHELVISLLLCFGGGVLLYTTFMHLQPEVRAGFQELQSQGKLPGDDEGGMHLSELVFCAGFFLVYIVEELVHLILDIRPQESEKEVEVVHRTMSLRRCSARNVLDLENGHAHHVSNQMIPRAILTPGAPIKPVDNGVHIESTNEMANGDCKGRSSVTSSLEGLVGNNNGSASSILDVQATCKALETEYQHHRSHSHNHLVGLSGSDTGSELGVGVVMAKSLRGFLTVLALSFHAIFEGLAVGLEGSVSNVWYLFGAVATHKFVIAFCVGVELVTSRTRLSLILVYVATFAIVSPLGIGAGLMLGEYEGAGEGVAAVVLQGMAAGTLLYVVFFEILQRERANTQSGVFQLLAIMAGFGVMFALQMTSGHTHSHGGHSDSSRHAGSHHVHQHEHEDHHEHSMSSVSLAAFQTVTQRAADALSSKLAR